MMIKIISAYQSVLTHKKVNSIIDNEDSFLLVGEVINGYALHNLCIKTQPQLVTIESSLPGPSLSCLVDNIYSSFPRLNILIIIDSIDYNGIRKLTERGIGGCILQEGSAILFAQAMHTVGLGNVWFSKSLLVKMLQEKTNTYSNVAQNLCLTPRELEVAKLVAKGFSNKDVAKSLKIKERTIEFHVTNILQKLHIDNRVGIALWVHGSEFSLIQSG